MWQTLAWTALAVAMLCVITGPDTVRADIPVDCRYADIRGTWQFVETEHRGTRDEYCVNFTRIATQTTVRLEFPNRAVDTKTGAIGNWTMIYNQGFEIEIAGRTYFSFFKYDVRGRNGQAILAVSLCNETWNGFAHDTQTAQKWSCWRAHKLDPWTAKPPHLFEVAGDVEDLAQKGPKSKPLGSQISSKRFRHLGSLRSANSIPRPSDPTEEVIHAAAKLPESIDWRNRNGVNFVSPVRNQGQCGSCYAFGSLAMIESRMRIATNNTKKPILSTQQLLDCGTRYMQGCRGGFNFLAAGKYAKHYGIVSENCYPYAGYEKSECKISATNSECKTRTFVSDYYYVGGFFGACNEPLMRLELASNGPIVVGVLWGRTMSNEGRVIKCKPRPDPDSGKTEKDFKPIEEVNHSVLIVGYGVDHDSGLKYWIVKNSWGKTSGDHGYYYIERGVDACGIESAAFAATVIP